MRTLPAPDALPLALPADSVCLISSDGTQLASTLAQRLADRGVSVVTLHPPMATVSPEGQPLNGLPDVVLREMGEDVLRDRFTAVTTTYGRVGGLIYLHPRLPEGEAEVMLDSYRLTMADYPFLLAKVLQPALTEMRSPRSWFITVTHIDGVLGLTGCGKGDLIAGGIGGLTKTLRLEWPEVFCRAIDLDPMIDVDRRVDLILAELSDPNRLIAEVGWRGNGRVTLAAEVECGR